MSGYPDDRNDRDDDRGDERRDDEHDISRAKSMVLAPAIGLMVVAAFGLLSIGINLVQYGSLDAQFDAEVKKIEDNQGIPANQKKDQIDLMNKIREWVKVGLLPYLGVVGLVSLLVLLSGVKLMNLSSPGLVTFGAILSFLPCVSGCCVLGLVFGIWAMMAMSKPEVKAGFAARRRASSSPDNY